MRNIRRSHGALAAFVLSSILAQPARAVVLGQVDDFENGTTLNWHTGSPLNPNPPVNVADGGPTGAGDAFLRLRSNGILSGAGGRLTVINSIQWAGNYTAAGVVKISADVRNMGTTQLSLRLLIQQTPTQRYLTAPVMLPAGGGWVRATWQVDAANLFANPANVPPGNAATALTQVTELRIFHNPQAQFPGPDLIADLGVDNVRAEGASADRDADGVPDASDNCPFFANPNQLDTNQNGRGNACECGDQNADGTVNVQDLIAINIAIFNPQTATPLCDSNGDNSCTVGDIVAANRTIFTPKTSVCARQPVPGP